MLVAVAVAWPALAQNEVFHFSKGSLIIPEQANLQTGCGITSAYGLVWRLLQSNQPGGYNANHPVTIYWAINGAKVSPNRCVPSNVHTPPSPSTGAWNDPAWNDGCDLGLHNDAEQPVVPVDYAAPFPASGIYPDAPVPNYATSSTYARPAFPQVKLDGTSTPRFTDVQYMGGPFVIDARDVPNVIGFLKSSTSADVTQFTTPCSCSTFPNTACHYVQMHQATVGFDAPIARASNQVPSKAALLNSGDGVSTGILDGYLKNAGLSFPGAAGCPEGTQSGCSLNGGQPGMIYDQFDAIEDLISTADHPYGLLDSRNDRGQLVYRIFWTPHWTVGDANFSEYVPNGDGASTQRENALNNIAHFADQKGAGLMAECASIESYEGSYQGNSVTYPAYSTATQFLFTDTIQKNYLSSWSGRNCSDPDYLALPQPRPQCMVYPDPGDPQGQLGDFAFAGTGGHVHNFKPNWLLGSVYRPSDQRLMTSWINFSDGDYPANDGADDQDGWDFVDVAQKDGDAQKATIVYLGGHDYTKSVAGNRIVLNTLLNLGLATSDVSVTLSGPGTVTAGTTVQYAVEVSNAGPSNGTGIRVSVPLPAGASALDFGGSDPAWSCVAADSGDVCTLTDPIGFGPAPALFANVSWSSSASGGSTVAASVQTQSKDPDPSNNSATLAVTFTTSADLSVSVAPVGGVIAGTGVTLSIQPANAGPSDAQAVTLTQTLPPGFTQVQPDDANGWSCAVAADASGNTVLSCSRPGLAVGEGAPLHVSANAPSTLGRYSVTTGIASDVSDPDTTNNQQTTDVNVTSSVSDLALALSGPATGEADLPLRYAVHVLNQGPSQAANLTVSVALPGNAALAGTPTGAGWTCDAPAGGAVRCVQAPATDVGATTPDLTFTLTPPREGGTVQVSAVASSDSTDPNPADNSATVTTEVAASADLAVTLAASGAAVPASSTLRYTLGASNLGPSQASAVSLSATLPAGFTLISTTTSTWSCATQDGSAGETVVTCTAAALPVGTSGSVLLTVLSPPTPGSFTVSATVQSTTADPALANNQAQVSTTVGTALADLAITLDGPSAANARDLLGYVVQTRNLGPSLDDGVQVAIPLPPGVAFQSASGSGWSCAPGADGLFCTFAGTLSSGQEAPALGFQLVAPAEAGTVSVSARVAGNAADPQTANNVAGPVLTEIAAVADLGVTLTPSANRVAPQGALHYRISVSNAGPSTALGAQVELTLPAGAVLGSASGIGWTCQASASGARCTTPSVTSGSGFVIDAQLSAPAVAGPFEAVAHVSSATADPQSGNDTASATVTVDPLAHVALTAAGPAQAVVRSPLAYQVTVSNTGGSAANAVALTQVLPAGAAYVSASGQGWSCTAGAPSGAPAQVTVSCALAAALAPGASSTLALNATAPEQSGQVTSTFALATASPNSAAEKETHAEVRTAVADEELTAIAYLATGGGCTSAGGSGPLAPLALVLLAMALVGRRVQVPSLCRLCAVAALLLGTAARAQRSPTPGIDAQRFRPGPGGLDLLSLESPRVLAGSWHVGLMVHVANEPLDLRLADSLALQNRIVSRQVTTDLVGSFAFAQRVEVGWVVPFTLQSTQALPARSEYASYQPAGSGIGDVRVVPKVRLLGEQWGPSLGFSAPLVLPTAGGKDFLGQRGFGVEPKLLAEYSDFAFRVVANVGVALRRETAFMNLRSGNELTYGLGGEVLLGHDFSAQATVAGGLGLTSHEATAANHPLEVLAALRWAASDTLSVQLAGGPGIGQAYGTPSYRMLIGVSWTAPPERAAKEVPARSWKAFVARQNALRASGAAQPDQPH